VVLPERFELSASPLQREKLRIKCSNHSAVASVTCGQFRICTVVSWHAVAARSRRVVGDDEAAREYIDAPPERPNEIARVSSTVARDAAGSPSPSCRRR
jgi:hypothetical protein